MKKPEELSTNKPGVEVSDQIFDVLEAKGKAWTKPQLKILDAKKRTLSGLNFINDGPGYS